MDVVFIFMDESLQSRTDAAWLTGVLVGANQYPKVRDAMLQFSVDAQRKARVKHPAPMELHAVSLLSDLPKATNRLRYEVFTRVVDLVNEERLQVVSAGYSGATQIRKEQEKRLMPQGDKLYDFNLDAILRQFRLPSDALLVPVFDGIPGQGVGQKKRQPVDRYAYNTFIYGVHHGHHYRVARGAAGGYLPNFCNVVEPTFSDSARSPVLQLADIVGYLLNALDKPSAKPSPFKTRVRRIATKLDQSLVRRVEHTMTYIGGTAPASQPAPRSPAAS